MDNNNKEKFHENYIEGRNAVQTAKMAKTVRMAKTALAFLM